LKGAALGSAQLYVNLKILRFIFQPPPPPARATLKTNLCLQVNAIKVKKNVANAPKGFIYTEKYICTEDYLVD
jgi:hypothetical protein